MDTDDKPGAPIPGAEHAEPPPVGNSDNGNGQGDAPPDFKVTPEPPPEEPKPPREPPKPRPLRAAELQSKLEDFFGGVAVAIMFTGDEHCSRIMATQAPHLAEAWAELAKVNPRVKRIIEMMLQGSAWGQVITVTAATVIPMAAHHGLYPKGFPMPFSFGIGPPPPPSDDVADAERQDHPEG